MIRLRLFVLTAAAVAAVAATAVLAQTESALRGGVPVNSEGPAPPMQPPRNSADIEIRNYPEQPPLIPHSIEGYQIDLNSNKCLSCHARVRTGESGAPMLSITHFMDRDGQALAAVSPRRYFCTQCHVSQYEAKPPVKSDFVDIDTLLNSARPGERR
jgi:nitrate reductase (cytochrome), electron transfer subunit